MKNIEYPPIIWADRLISMQWNSEDLEPFANMNANTMSENNVLACGPGKQATISLPTHQITLKNPDEDSGQLYLLRLVKYNGFIILFIPDLFAKHEAEIANQHKDQYRKMKESILRKINVH